jgi:glutaredoxin 3
VAGKLNGPVKLYTTSWCGYCQAALSLLDERGVSYENVDLTDDAAELARVKAAHSWTTVPMILAGDELVGGFSELSALDAEGGLA